MNESHSNLPTPDDGRFAHINGSSTNGSSQSLVRSARTDLNGDLTPFAPVASSTTPAHVAAHPVDDDDTIDLGQYVRALVRRRALMARVFLGVLALGVLYTLLQKPVYQSSAMILVSSPAGGGGGLNIPAGFSGFQTLSRSLGQQMAIIQSPNIQRSASKRLDAPTLGALKGFVQTEIEPVRDADGIIVKVKARDPRAAAAYANAICDQYIDQSQQQNSEQVRQATNYVRTQLDLVKTRLQRASASLRDYRQRNNTVDLSGETDDLISRVGQLEGQRTGALAERGALQAQLRTVRSQLRELAANPETPSAIVRRPEVTRLRAELSELELKRIEQSREFNSNSRVIQDIDKQIREVNARLKAEEQTEVGAWQPNPLRQSLIATEAQLEGQVLAAEARLRGQEGAIKTARGELKLLPGRAYDLGQLVTDEAGQREGYEVLARKYQDLRIQEEQRVANARILTRAEPGGSPVSPRRTFNFLLSALLGSVLACAWALIVDRRDDRVHGDEDVQGATRLPILAHIPLIDRQTQPLLATTSRKTAPHLESFRMLRINLAYANFDETLRSVAITSSQPGEGKSTSAVNLATVMAMSGSRVILVDCDLRRPNLHTVFGLPNTQGFTQVAMGQVDLKAALQPTSVANLQVLTSGPMPRNPSELLDSRNGRAALERVVDEADFVVFDCPPALLLSDAQIVASVADAVLLVVGYAQASKRDVARTQQLLTRGGAKMLGVVFNKVDMGPDGAYGRYKSHREYFESDANADANAHNALSGGVSNGARLDGEGDKSGRIEAALPPTRGN